MWWWWFSYSDVSNTFHHQAPLSMGYPRQEDWRGLPFPSPGDLSNPGIKLWSPELQVDSLLTELRGKPSDKVRIIITSSI